MGSYGKLKKKKNQIESGADAIVSTLIMAPAGLILQQIE